MRKTLILGGGSIAKAIIQGLMKNNYDPNKFVVVDRNQGKCDFITNTYGIPAFTEYGHVIQDIDPIFLAVKPQGAKETCLNLAPYIKSTTPLIVSVMAGVTVAMLKSWLGNHPIVRTMPNTPSLIQAGATGMFADPMVTEQQKIDIETMMAAIGKAIWFPLENNLDAVTALSGSGPAYYFYLMSCMQDAAVAMGLPEGDAKALTIQTALGAAKLALETDAPFKELQNQVTSKGGTTEAALNVMQQLNIKHIIDTAMQAAKDRSEALSNSL